MGKNRYHTDVERAQVVAPQNWVVSTPNFKANWCQQVIRSKTTKKIYLGRNLWKSEKDW